MSLTFTNIYIYENKFTEIILSVVSIEQRLREMQKKLSEIAEIPKILSSTLETVSQTFDKIVKPEGSEHENENDTCSEIDSLDSLDYDDESDEHFDNEPEETPESDYVSVSSEEVSNYCYTFRLNWCNVPEVKIDPTPEEKEKLEKQEKLSKVEKSWPWADREKIIYKLVYILNSMYILSMEFL